MPKKSIEINPFDGGLNNYADARDIKENELAAASNLNTDQPGRIKIGKRIHSVAARTGADDVQTGLGLFHYSSDYAANNTEANTEYQVLFNSSTNHLLRRTLSDTNFTSLVALGAAYTPVYYSIDGSLKLSDQTLSSDSKFLGVTDVNYFGEAQDNFFTTTNAYIDPPTDGDLTKDPADGTDVPPSQNTGHLDWIVQQKTGSKSDWFSFDKNDTNDTALRNTTIGGIINQYSSTTNTDLTQTEYDSDTTYVLSSDSGISAVSGQMYKAIKGSGSNANGVDYNRVLLRFDPSSPKNYEEKSIFISLYFTSAVKNNLKSGAVKIRVGNFINNEGTSGNDCYVYEFGSNQITADDWTVLELAHGQHDEVEGNPNASGLDESFCTIKVSFSPASTANPSSLILAHSFFAFLPSFSKRDFAVLLHPLTITNEFHASLVPDVGGATNISIFLFGRLASISLQFLYGFSTSFPSMSTLDAKALHNCSFVKSASGAFTECANEIPSLPITISIISATPFFSHKAFSFVLIALDAFVISG